MTEHTAAQTRTEIAAATDRLAELDHDAQSYLDLFAWRDDLYSELFAMHADLTAA
jgi:hypothetical protein